MLYGPRPDSRACINPVADSRSRLSVGAFIVFLDSIPNLNRVALGIKDNVTQIRICILRGRCSKCGYSSSYRQSLPTFCVHFECATDQQSITDHDCTVETPWETRDLDCNILAYRLTLDLQTSLRNLVLTPKYPVRTLFERIRGLVVSIATSCTSRCIICNQDLGCRVSRAMSCENTGCRESLNAWPLPVRLSPLRRDPSVLDLLLTLAMGELEVKVPPPGKDPDDYPMTVPDMISAVNSFPAMHAGITTSELIGRGRLRNNRRLILVWLCILFEGMLVPTPQDSEVAAMSAHQSLGFSS